MWLRFILFLDLLKCIRFFMCVRVIQKKHFVVSVFTNFSLVSKKQKIINISENCQFKVKYMFTLFAKMKLFVFLFWKSYKSPKYLNCELIFSFFQHYVISALTKFRHNFTMVEKFHNETSSELKNLDKCSIKVGVTRT